MYQEQILAIKAFWDFLLERCGHIDSLEVDSLDVGTGGFSHLETFGDGIDSINLLGALEQSPSNAALLT